MVDQEYPAEPVILTDYKDKEIQCIDCPTVFKFTAGEQEFYTRNNYAEPKRCPPCRKAKKARMANKNTARGFRRNDYGPRDQQPY